jgi:hypothetical protein
LLKSGKTFTLVGAVDAIVPKRTERLGGTPQINNPHG